MEEDLIKTNKEQFESYFSNVQYSREIPLSGNLLEIYWIADTFKLMRNDSDFIGALLLSWIKNKKVLIKKKSKTFFTKEKTIIEFLNDAIFEDKTEEKVYLFIKNISLNNLLEPKEFAEWCLINIQELHNFLLSIKFEIQKTLETKNLLTIIPVSDEDISDEHIQKLMDQFVDNEKYPSFDHQYQKKITTVVSTQVRNIDKVSLSEEISVQAKKIAGLKKFILDFSNLNNRKSEEVIIWDNYLIIATLLGVADNIEDEFRSLYPQFIIPNYYVSRTEKRIVENISKNND